jgi:hypothetical protein
VVWGSKDRPLDNNERERHGRTLTTSTEEYAVRKRNYESVVLLHAEEAEQAIAIMRERGKTASLEFLMASYEPDESTLVDHRMPPWNDGDKLYENDEFVLYYNLDSPYIGLVRKLSRSSLA